MHWPVEELWKNALRVMLGKRDHAHAWCPSMNVRLPSFECPIPHTHAPVPLNALREARVKEEFRISNWHSRPQCQGIMDDLFGAPMPLFLLCPHVNHLQTVYTSDVYTRLVLCPHCVHGKIAISSTVREPYNLQHPNQTSYLWISMTSYLQKEDFAQVYFDQNLSWAYVTGFTRTE